MNKITFENMIINETKFGTATDIFYMTYCLKVIIKIFLQIFHKYVSYCLGT